MALFDGVSMPTEAYIADPWVQWKHIDGPLLYWAGRIHWLTWRERFQIWVGAATVESIAQKHWPVRKKWRDAVLKASPSDPQTTYSA